MIESRLGKTSKTIWYRLSVYINIALFFIVAIGIYFLIFDCTDGFTKQIGNPWLVTRDIAFIAVALSLIFFQFFRNIYIIMKRSL